MIDNSIRTRLLAGDTTTLSSEELLAALLKMSSRKKINASRRAKHFIRRFGSLGDVLVEDAEVLQEASYIDENIVLLFRLVRAVATHLMREQARERTVLSSTDALIEYCKVSMSALRRERFVVLFLDAKNALISEVSIDGTVDHAPVYPREIARRALAQNAISIILVHNHPSGDPQPSLADIQMTDKIAACCGALGIRIIDHFIIGRSRCTSFRQAGLLNDEFKYFGNM